MFVSAWWLNNVVELEDGECEQQLALQCVRHDLRSRVLVRCSCISVLFLAFRALLFE